MTWKKVNPFFSSRVPVYVEVQVHGDVRQERDERDGVVRGVVEDGDNASAVAPTSRGIRAEKRRQKMYSHVKSVFWLIDWLIDDIMTNWNQGKIETKVKKLGDKIMYSCVKLS